MLMRCRRLLAPAAVAQAVVKTARVTEGQLQDCNASVARVRVASATLDAPRRLLRSGGYRGSAVMRWTVWSSRPSSSGFDFVRGSSSESGDP